MWPPFAARIDTLQSQALLPRLQPRTKVKPAVHLAGTASSPACAGVKRHERTAKVMCWPNAAGVVGVDSMSVVWPPASTVNVAFTGHRIGRWRTLRSSISAGFNMLIGYTGAFPEASRGGASYSPSQVTL